MTGRAARKPKTHLASMRTTAGAWRALRLATWDRSASTDPSSSASCSSGRYTPSAAGRPADEDDKGTRTVPHVRSPARPTSAYVSRSAGRVRIRRRPSGSAESAQTSGGVLTLGCMTYSGVFWGG